jgi:hypothetical protein
VLLAAQPELVTLVQQVVQRVLTRHLKLKTPWRDGTTHLVMSPLEFMLRLAALVPRPRLHLIRFGVRVTSLREVSGTPLRKHSVLAPNAKLRQPRSARSRRFRLGRSASAWRGCSSGSSTSTCKPARTAAAGN